ncbi:MAG: DUF4139 domain-containing protein [Cytophagales bacterium]|nr:MAG: DUF4139 domain-containing protein [Cytophagales bacterium]TAF60302.1 MAG: DUF4139 domain-containing protein [Cytophagales bacterium]
MKALSFALAASLLMFNTLDILAQTKETKPIVKNQKVSVFKNGSGFFVKTVEPGMAEKTATISDLPQAAMGTFWFAALDNSMKSVKSLNKTSDVEMPVGGKWPSMISANVGKNIKVTLHDNTNYEGKIEQVMDDIVYLSSAQGWLAINASNCKHVSFSVAPKLTSTVQNTTRVLEIEFEKANSKQQVEMMYLQSNISWLPMYRVTLLDESRAKINLSANLVNDAEDLVNADVNLVVGVPNFSHSSHLSPLVTSRDAVSTLYDLTNASSSLNFYERRAAPIVAQSFSNAVTSTDMGYANDEADGYAVSDVVGNSNTEGDTQEDLFFYRLDKFSLPKGGRAHLTLFEAEVPYKHVYEVSLPYSAHTAGFRYQESQPNRVWHSIELQNKTNYPWTTAPALVLKNNDPLSQDVSKYTAKNGRSLIKLTVAPDISVKDNEEQLSQEAGPKVRGKSYDVLTIEASIDLKNNKDKAVELDIARTIMGALKSSSTDWKNNKKPNTNETLNPYNNVNWLVKLEPGEEKKITYQYQVYVRNK